MRDLENYKTGALLFHVKHRRDFSDLEFQGQDFSWISQRPLSAAEMFHVKRSGLLFKMRCVFLKVNKQHGQIAGRNARDSGGLGYG